MDFFNSFYVRLYHITQQRRIREVHCLVMFLNL